MNYRHLYHAGSFADVFKHIVLVLLIEALKRKEKPFCYLDTHAGIGRYDLFSEPAQKTREFENGVSTLLKQKKFPPELNKYLKVLHDINNNDLATIQFYPGSPVIVRNLLGPNDRMIVTELHPAEFQVLKHEFAGDKQVAVHHMDGYQALKAFLPPKERRGLVFIDPPFEQPDEFETLFHALLLAYKLWETGIYAAWYPLKNLSEVKKFYQNLENSPLEKILLLEFAIYPLDSPLGLNGCGMIVVNPPYQWDKQLETLLPWLWQALSPQKLGLYRIEKLKK